MLSYQHIYHAGNLADVQKHALLCAMLDYVTQKDKPLSYIETHAGRGLYQLDAPEALRTGEAAAGIDLIERRKLIAKDHPYMRALRQVKQRHGDRAYPGSPLLASCCLRPQDRLHLAELHPRENAALRDALSGSGATIQQQDGLAMALALCPPEPRRGMLLIDPSYELKTEYETIPDTIAKLNRKWNVGIIALWYPILTSGPHEAMLNALERLDLPKTLRHEVRFPPAREGHRMVGSGMFIVNAPWGLAEETSLLDRVFTQL